MTEMCLAKFAQAVSFSKDVGLELGDTLRRDWALLLAAGCFSWRASGKE